MRIRLLGIQPNSCSYATPYVDADVTASMLIIQNNVYLSSNASCSKYKPPKIDRSHIGRDCNEEFWSTFMKTWTVFKELTELSEPEKPRHLLKCCDEDLGDANLKGHEGIINSSEQNIVI